MRKRRRVTPSRLDVAFFLLLIQATALGLFLWHAYHGFVWRALVDLSIIGVIKFLPFGRR